MGSRTARGVKASNSLAQVRYTIAAAAKLLRPPRLPPPPSSSFLFLRNIQHDGNETSRCPCAVHNTRLFAGNRQANFIVNLQNGSKNHGNQHENAFKQLSFHTETYNFTNINESLRQLKFHLTGLFFHQQIS